MLFEAYWNDGYNVYSVTLKMSYTDVNGNASSQNLTLYRSDLINYNETDYYCKTLEGASDEAEGVESHQWFKASELNGLKQVR